MLFLNGMHSPVFDWIMWWSSDRFVWLPLYLFLLIIYIRKLKSSALWPIIITILAVALSDFLSVHVIKESVHRLRPTYDAEIGEFVHSLNGYIGGLYGFVSSHASNSFALSVMAMLFIRSRQVNILMFSWAVLISYSRIYLGVHFPGDVICGALFGSFLALVLYYGWRKIPFFHSTG